MAFRSSRSQGQGHCTLYLKDDDTTESDAWELLAARSESTSIGQGGFQLQWLFLNAPFLTHKEMFKLQPYFEDTAVW